MGPNNIDFHCMTNTTIFPKYLILLHRRKKVIHVKWWCINYDRIYIFELIISLWNHQGAQIIKKELDLQIKKKKS